MRDDLAATIRQLQFTEPLRRVPLQHAIDALRLPPGTCSLDIGCGIGLQALQLADSLPPARFSECKRPIGRRIVWKGFRGFHRSPGMLRIWASEGR